MEALLRPGAEYAHHEGRLPRRDRTRTMNLQLPLRERRPREWRRRRQLGVPMSVGRLAARVVIGGLFIGHGTQKLFGRFGGPGRAGTEAMMESLDLRPGKVHALAAGLTETVSGALLAAGLAAAAAGAGITRGVDTPPPQGARTEGPRAGEGGGGGK